jgi:hypothetical protein
MDTAEPTFEEYAKVELFGHTVLIARVTKAPIGDFIRADVLNADGTTSHTKLLNPKAVYALSLVSKEVALALAQRYQAEPPATRYELPQIAAPDTSDHPEGWED